MRTVEQVVSDLRNVQSDVLAAQKKEDALTQELRAIYNAAMAGLGIASVEVK